CSSGSAVGVVVHVDAIHAIAVLVGPVSGVGELISKSTVSLIGVEGSSNLRGDADDSRLQSCERSPVAAIQRKFADRRRFHRGRHRRSGGLYIGSETGDFNVLRNAL